MTAAVRRLFFALWPDESVRLALRRSARRVVRQSGGRPVPPANYHVTLAFLGGVPAAQLDAVLAAAAPIAISRFEMTLDTLGFWSRPRVLWLGPAAPPAQLPALAATLVDAMMSIELSIEKITYRPHLTLIRKSDPVPAGLAVMPVRWPVSDFVLAESVTRHAGPEYRVVERFGAGSHSEPNGV